MGQVSDMLAKDPSSVLLEGNELVKEPEQVEPEKKVEPEPEKKVEPEKVEPEKKVETKVEPEPINKVKVYSEIAGQDFEDEEKATTYFTSLKERATKAEELANRITELEAGVDPKKFFKNEQEYHRQLALIQFPDYNPDLVDKVFTKDLTALSDLEVIRLHKRLTDPDIYENDSDVNTSIEKKFDISLEDIKTVGEIEDRATQLELKSMAKQARKEFGEIKEKLKIPEAIKPAEVNQKTTEEKQKEINTLKLQLTPILESIPEKLKGEKIAYKETDGDGTETVVFEYQIEDDFVKGVKKEIQATADVLAQRGVDVSKIDKNKLIADSIDALIKKYKGDNFDKILKAFKTKIDKDHADKEVDEYHNPRRVSNQEAPKADNEQQASISKTEDKLERRMRGEKV